MKLTSLKQAFLERPEFAKLSKETRRSYRRHLHFTDFMNDRAVNEISRNDWISSFASLRPATARQTIAIHSAMLSFGMDIGVLYNNQLSRAKKPKIGSHARWTPDQVRQFEEWLAAASKEPEVVAAKAAYVSAKHSLQRLGDIALAKMDQWDGTQFRFTQEKTGNVVTFAPKGALKDLIYERMAKRAEYLVPMPDNISNRKKYLDKVFREATRAAGVTAVFHGLRKTGACILDEKGVKRAMIGALLGHKTARMTEEYCEEADRERMASEAAASLGD